MADSKPGMDKPDMDMPDMDRPDMDKPDMTAVLKAVADSPKRDNSAYHKAMAEARQAFENAEAALGGPITVKTKTKLKSNGRYVVKWVFERAD